MDRLRRGLTHRFRKPATRQDPRVRIPPCPYPAVPGIRAPPFFAGFGRGKERTTENSHTSDRTDTQLFGALARALGTRAENLSTGRFSDGCVCIVPLAAGGCDVSDCEKGHILNTESFSSARSACICAAGRLSLSSEEEENTVSLFEKYASED